MYQLKNPLSQKPNLDFFVKGVDYVAILHVVGIILYVHHVLICTALF